MLSHTVGNTVSTRSGTVFPTAGKTVPNGWGESTGTLWSDELLYFPDQKSMFRTMRIGCPKKYTEVIFPLFRVTLLYYKDR